MSQREKLKFNICNLVNFKDKSHNIKLRSDNNNSEDTSTNTVASVPSLKDMEFNWIEDY